MNYSNFKHPKSIVLIMAIFSLSFFFACEEDNESSTIEGKWKREGNETWVISIEGSTAEFVQFGESWWSTANEQGYVDVGDDFIKGIEKEESSTWSCDNRWVKWKGDDVTDVYWSDKAELTLSEDGSKLILESWATYDGESYHDKLTYIKSSE